MQIPDNMFWYYWSFRKYSVVIFYVLHHISHEMNACLQVLQFESETVQYMFTRSFFYFKHVAQKLALLMLKNEAQESIFMSDIPQQCSLWIINITTDTFLLGGTGVCKWRETTRDTAVCKSIGKLAFTEIGLALLILNSDTRCQISRTNNLRLDKSVSRSIGLSRFHLGE